MGLAGAAATATRFWGARASYWENGCGTGTRARLPAFARYGDLAQLQYDDGKCELAGNEATSDVDMRRNGRYGSGTVHTGLPAFTSSPPLVGMMRLPRTIRHRFETVNKTMRA